jgi:cytochrome c peroxidase
MKFSFLGLLGLMLALSSCDSKFDYIDYSESQAAQMTALKPFGLDDYQVVLPNHLQRSGLFPRPIDGQKARLGRVIFYDKSLSSDRKVSCANCHLQEHGFADVTAKSKGVNDRESTRNSIALSSVVNFSAYYGTDLNGPTAIRFFWDNRAETVEQQSRGAFTNPDEMNMHMDRIVETIKGNEYYIPLFQKAYNTDGDEKTIPEITEARIYEAMSNFINSMGSYQSKFDVEADKGISANDFFGPDKYDDQFSGFTSDENAGKALYLANCASCHTRDHGRPQLDFANNGLDAVSADKGVGGVAGNENKADLQGVFKIPTLRNIEVSHPYMHDGRFATLEQVIDHYSNGIQSNPNLHANLRGTNGLAKQMNFTPVQKAQLIAFLKTLTDDVVKTEERFADPFK